MGSVKNIEQWFLIHKWTSLIYALFLLELCVTGLSLVFESETDAWVSRDIPCAKVAPESPDGQPGHVNKCVMMINLIRLCPLKITS